MHSPTHSNTPEIQSNELRKAALFFRAINHKLRVEILQVLHKNQKMMVTEIYRKLKLEQSVASQHLAILRKAGLVNTEREGKTILYSVNYKQVDKLHVLANQLLKK